MPAYNSGDIRNIAFCGAAASGKTSLTEALLARAGVIQTPGTIEKGNTQSDFDEQEIALQHSLFPALLSMDYEQIHVNLLDTPGYPDFLGRALSVLPAVETVAVLIDATEGVTATSQQIMDWARDRGHERLLIINKIDVEGVDLAACLQQIRDVFGPECLPLNLPAGNGKEVVDCFFAPDGVETDFSGVSEAHTEIVDQVVEMDETLMEIYLEQGQELAPAQLHDPFERAMRDGHLIPVCFVSARSGVGVDQLLNVFARLMPAPEEGNPPEFFLGEGSNAEAVSFSGAADAHVVAHVFKVDIDPFIGKLAFFRIHQGTINRDSQLFIGDGRKPFRVGHLLKIQGKQHQEVAQGIPGDICAIAKVDEVHFDAVLHDSHEEDHIHLRSIELPQPMQGLAIEARSKGDEQKISDALHKLAASDPSIQVEHIAALNETVLRAQGDLHLRVLLETMKQKHHVDVNTHIPSIAYKETIGGKAEAQYRHKKQSGGAGQFGEVAIRIAPLQRGEGFRFVDQVVGGVIPRQFIPAVEKGVRQVMKEGVIAGYAMQDIEVCLYDGKHHAVDSKEIAFVMAGKKAFIEAVRKAKPLVLEPVVSMQVEVPNQCMGDITADLSSKRARINNTEVQDNGSMRITADVPLSELDDYSSRLKSMTGGEGIFSVRFSHYDNVPGRVQKDLMDSYRPTNED